ncbi:MAG TPA: hypothetical protein VFC77_00940, partial [Myxococcota bacterium]|nr:hypothetical protein [Myxococcota bacterium]
SRAALQPPRRGAEAPCAPWLERVETAGGGTLEELRVSPALAVAVRHERLECGTRERVSSAGGR